MCIAALGDPHVREAVRGRLRTGLAGVGSHAGLLLLAGDLTDAGTREEAELLREELVGLDLPAIAVLGNHDLDSGEGQRIVEVLRDLGIHVLDGDGVVVETGGLRVGVAGMKGFGGGFDTTAQMPTEVVEDSSGIVESTASVERLGRALESLDADVRIALTHYAPVPDTLVGEPPVIWVHLGSRLLGEVIDAAAHLAIHGHAHRGSERGTTSAGCPVRNVAQHVLGRPYAVYTLTADGTLLPPAR